MFVVEGHYVGRDGERFEVVLQTYKMLYRVVIQS